MFTRTMTSTDSKGKTDLANASQQTRDLRGDFSSSQNRSVPIFSIDSGLYFDRNTQWFGKTTVKP